jgi:hypothetical protein
LSGKGVYQRYRKNSLLLSCNTRLWSEMIFLVDTNVFLKLFLRQDKKEECKSFLSNNIGNLNICEC